MDNSLVLDLQNREKEAVQKLKENYESRMRYVICSIVPHKEDQEEVLNDIWLRAWEKISLYDSYKGSFHTWLTTIARNCAINYLRKKKIEYVLLEDEKVSIVEENYIKIDIQQAIEQLTKEEQQLFYRKYYYCQSHLTIAAEMGLTIKAVESKIYRLKKKFQKLLGDGYNE